jgi:diguanylate cyclase (GGDEF)-like protein
MSSPENRRMDSRRPVLNPRILIIDDNAQIHEDFRKILATSDDGDAALAADECALFGAAATTRSRPSFELDFALQGEEGLERVRTALAAGRPYAMAFVDMRMPPGWDGLETIERLWAVDPDLQVAICSAQSDYDWMDVIARLGHADKLLIIKKPFEIIEIIQCASALTRKWQNERIVRGQVQTLERAVSTHTEGLDIANRKLRHVATHDALTGLPNRILLEDRLTQAMAHGEREGRMFALLAVNLDRFKLINDSLGHRAGDELLQEVARRLSGIARDVDTVVRSGGDDFMMIINPVATRVDATLMATRVIEALNATLRITGVETHTTPSIGIAIFPADGVTVEALISHADAAMHCAKQRGRNNAQCYEAGMDTHTRDAARLQSDLHEAIALNQFELYYQPKVEVASGVVRSVEALIRWRHPERGLVCPAEFIPFAEDYGLIGVIGEWVVREACRQASAWRRAGLPAVRVAVNLSASQFRHGKLLETVKEALNDARLDPQNLEVELTESAVMSDPAGSVAILEQLSTMGVLVSVDDFGTGYSSIGYLRRFPIDKLKIDQSFINEIATRSDDACIVRAIVSLAHCLKLKVVAEGVETSEQLTILKSLGCDQYQGYYFSPAITADAFEDLLRRQQNDSEAVAQSDVERTHSKLSTHRAR